jgi:hypothetical protein
MARRLLAEAEAQPALIGRTTPLKLTKKPVAEPFPALALLSDPTLNVKQYLEDLVSIAVNSAQQAEEISLQAEAASRKARRSMVLVGTFGALGLMVGIAGFAASRSANIRLAEVRDEVSGLQDLQHQAQDQLADIAARTAEQREALEVTPQPRVSPAAVVSSPWPSSPQQAAHYASDPWPDSRPISRRVPVAVPRSRPVVVPQFFADIQRSFRAIFR